MYTYFVVEKELDLLGLFFHIFERSGDLALSTIVKKISLIKCICLAMTIGFIYFLLVLFCFYLFGVKKNRTMKIRVV